MYVVYKDVAASGDCGQIGPSSAAVTLGYDPSEVQSYLPGGLSKVAPIDYAQLWSNCTTKHPSDTVSQPPSCLDITVSEELSKCQATWSQFEASQDNQDAHCYPQLSYPTGLQKVNTAWASCADAKTVGHPTPLFDPPRTLEAATAMVPGPSSTNAGDAAPSPGIDPGPSPTPPPSPVVNPPSNTPSNPDPVQSTPTDSQGNSPSSPNSVNDPPVNPPKNSPSNPGPGGEPSSANQQSSTDPNVAGDAPVNPPQGSSSNPDPINSPSSGNPSQPQQSPTNLDPPSNAPNNPPQVSPLDTKPVSDPTNGDPKVPGSSGAATNQNPQNPANPGKPDESPPSNNPQKTNEPANSSPPNGNEPQSPSDPITPSPGAANSDPEVAASPLTTTVQGHSIEASPGANYVVVDGQSVTHGSNPITVSGTPIALNSNSKLILGTSTIQDIFPIPSPGNAAGVPPAVPAAPFTTTIQGHSIEAQPSAGVVVIDGQSVTRGAATATISGTPIALGSNGDLILGSSTVQNVLPAPSAAAESTFSVGNQVVTLSSNNLVGAGTTLKPNAPAITINGTPVSLGPSALQIGSSTVPLNEAATITSAPIANIGGQTYTASQVTSGLVIAGSTLQVGSSALTISGTPVSLGPSALVVGISSIPYQDGSNSAIATPITIAGQTYTASENSNGDVILAGSTLHVGGTAMTISGTPVELQSSALIVGSQIIPLSADTAETTQGIGGFVFSGLKSGPGQPPTTANGPGSGNGTGPSGGSGTGGTKAFTGDGVRDIGMGTRVVWAMGLGTVIVGLTGIF